MTISADRWAKLPRWVREHIEQLERDNDALTTANEALRNPNQTPTRTIHDPYGEDRFGRGKTYLNDHYTVRFLLGEALIDNNHDYIDARVTREYAGAPLHLQLMASHGIELRPQSSNTMRAWVERR